MNQTLPDTSEPEEVWKPTFIDPKYLVSNLGRGKSPKGQILRTPPNVQGYSQVTIRYNVSVSILVCTAFHGSKPFEGACALHRNDNKLDNTETNLYWGTKQDNIDDRKRNGISCGGGIYGNNKLDWPQVREIRARVKAGELPSRIYNEYEVTDVTIYNIVNNKAWRESDV